MAKQAEQKIRVRLGELTIIDGKPHKPGEVVEMFQQTYDDLQHAAKRRRRPRNDEPLDTYGPVEPPEPPAKKK